MCRESKGWGGWEIGQCMLAVLWRDGGGEEEEEEERGSFIGLVLIARFCLLWSGAEQLSISFAA